jgi:hypothetical protein
MDWPSRDYTIIDLYPEADAHRIARHTYPWYAHITCAISSTGLITIVMPEWVQTFSLTGQRIHSLCLFDPHRILFAFAEYSNTGEILAITRNRALLPKRMRRRIYDRNAAGRDAAECKAVKPANQEPLKTSSHAVILMRAQDAPSQPQIVALESRPRSVHFTSAATLLVRSTQGARPIVITPATLAVKAKHPEVRHSLLKNSITRPLAKRTDKGVLTITKLASADCHHDSRHEIMLLKSTGVRGVGQAGIEAGSIRPEYKFVDFDATADGRMVAVLIRNGVVQVWRDSPAISTMIILPRYLRIVPNARVFIARGGRCICINSMSHMLYYLESRTHQTFELAHTTQNAGLCIGIASDNAYIFVTPAWNDGARCGYPAKLVIRLPEREVRHRHAWSHVTWAIADHRANRGHPFLDSLQRPEMLSMLDAMLGFVLPKKAITTGATDVG